MVRHRLEDGSATDVVGELVEVGACLVVLPDDGPARSVQLADVVASKVVPARTVRPSSSADAVQRVAALGWPGLEQERLGGWVLRAAGGFTSRANSVLAVGDPGMPVPEALGVVERFYRARSLVPRVQVPFPLTGPHDPARGLDAELAERGWEGDAPTLLMTVDLRVRTRPEHDAGAGLWTDVADQPDADWLGLYRYRGGGLPEGASRVLTAAAWQRFVTLRSPGADGGTAVAVAVGRVAVANGWAGVTAMQVDEDYRRRGLGAAVLGRLLELGMAQGARFGYLQVAAANAPAVALYEAAGFTGHHRYRYRSAPA